MPEVQDHHLIGAGVLLPRIQLFHHLLASADHRLGAPHADDLPFLLGKKVAFGNSGCVAMAVPDSERGRDLIARTPARTVLLAAALVVTLLVATTAQAQQCAEESFEDVGYVVCTIDPAASDLRLFWKNDQGEPYRTFSKVADAVSEQGLELVLAVNAGMYQSDFSPLGLYVENREQLRPADTASIGGPPRQIPNFYKKPNGFFFLGEMGAGILPTDEFLDAQPTVRFATQSGPMLVIGDELHPALIPGSTDRTRRSGVGVCEGGQIRFAISNGAVNFHKFARLFRDELARPNALFLDGGRALGFTCLKWTATTFPGTAAMGLSSGS